MDALLRVTPSTEKNKIFSQSQFMVITMICWVSAQLGRPIFSVLHGFSLCQNWNRCGVFLNPCHERYPVWIRHTWVCHFKFFKHCWGERFSEEPNQDCILLGLLQVSTMKQQNVDQRKRALFSSWQIWRDSSLSPGKQANPNYFEINSLLRSCS